MVRPRRKGLRDNIGLERVRPPTVAQLRSTIPAPRSAPETASEVFRVLLLLTFMESKRKARQLARAQAQRLEGLARQEV